MILSPGDKHDPSTPSADWLAMEAYWRQALALSGGIEAMRAAGETYLPRWEGEQRRVYETRRRTAKLTNVFMDVLESLAAQPFKEPVRMEDDASPDLIDFAMNVDATGRTLHDFALAAFMLALRDGVAWVIVDYPDSMPAGSVPRTVADERAMGLRPYWSLYGALDVIDVETVTWMGKERVLSMRLRETETGRDGYATTATERIRILRDAFPAGGVTSETWIKTEEKWVMETEPADLTIGTIPAVPVLLGHRIGQTWRVKPPLRAACDLQIELYQEENALKNIRTMSAFPMLAIHGTSPPEGGDGAPSPMTVGPGQVLYSGTDGSIGYVEPSASSLNFLKESRRDTEKEIRELGRQPLTAQSGNLTAITTAVAAEKANCALAAWAGTMSHALDLMLEVTAEWMGVDDPVTGVKVFDNFDAGMSDDASLAQVIAMQNAGIVSRAAVVDEAKRRGVLSPSFDAAADAVAVASESARDILTQDDFGQ